MFSLFAVALAAPTIEIEVSDSSISEVFLVCPDRTVSSKVYGGKAIFDDHVNGCRVEVRSRIGEIASPGRYECDAQMGCSAKGVAHRSVSDSPGRLNIILTDSSADMFELKCANGLRQRAKVSENVAVFESVPSSGACTAFYKGSAPAKVDNLAPGTWKCNAIGGVGKCRQMSAPKVEPVAPAVEE